LGVLVASLSSSCFIVFAVTLIVEDMKREEFLSRNKTKLL
jgi:hypothetical protein